MSQNKAKESFIDNVTREFKKDKKKTVVSLGKSIAHVVPSIPHDFNGKDGQALLAAMLRVFDEVVLIVDYKKKKENKDV